jgi:hypothetical protein
VDARTAGRRIVRVVGILQLLDELPEAIAQRPGRIWNVFARSLGEQGAGGRTALAWRWALTGTCPSPITLTPAVRSSVQRWSDSTPVRALDEQLAALA